MGGFVHLELSTSNAAKAKGFYSKVFGWKYDDTKMPEGVYSMVKGQMAPGIAVQQAPMPDMPSSWIGYVEVADVQRTVAKAGKAGATVTVPYFSVPGYGEGAWMIDPTGAPVAIWHSFAPKASTKKRSKKKAKKRTAKKAAKRKPAKKKARKKASRKKASKKKTAKRKVTKKKATNKKAGRKTAKKRVAKKKTQRRAKSKKKRAKKKR